MYEISTVGKFVETESKLKLPPEPGGGRTGELLTVTEFLFAVIGRFRTR